MDNIKIKKLLLIICIILIVSTGVIGLTLSAFTSSDQVVNKFEVGDVNIENKEPDFEEKEYEEEEPIQKTVTIQNVTTKTPSLVRVNITPRWVDEDGNPWSGDARIVELNYFDDNIIGYNMNSFPAKKWVYGEDGYYYYAAILPPNTETAKILKDVTINLDATDSEGNKLVKNPDDYIGKTLIVDVNSEAVQPTELAYKDAWGIIHLNIKNMLNKIIKYEYWPKNI